MGAVLEEALEDFSKSRESVRRITISAGSFVVKGEAGEEEAKPITVHCGTKKMVTVGLVEQVLVVVLILAEKPPQVKEANQGPDFDLIGVSREALRPLTSDGIERGMDFSDPPVGVLRDVPDDVRCDEQTPHLLLASEVLRWWPYSWTVRHNVLPSLMTSNLWLLVGPHNVPTTPAIQRGGILFHGSGKRALLVVGRVEGFVQG